MVVLSSGDNVFFRGPFGNVSKPAKIVQIDAQNNTFLIKYYKDEEEEIVPQVQVVPLIVGDEYWNELMRNEPYFEHDIGIQNLLKTFRQHQQMEEMEENILTDSLYTNHTALAENLPQDQRTNLNIFQQQNAPNMDEAKTKFLVDLYNFMDIIGQQIVKTPFLGYQELDLYRLYQIVTKKGGMDEVTKRQEWKSVYQELDIPTMSTSASYNTRTNYKKYLYLYELEHFRPTIERLSFSESKDCAFLFNIGQYVRLTSTDGQCYYAVISKRKFHKTNLYYIHYNGWSTSHDEWMSESVLQSLSSEENVDPKRLCNPPPSRSSKSNHIIEDPIVIAEKHYHSKNKKGKKSNNKDNVKTTISIALATTGTHSLAEYGPTCENISASDDDHANRKRERLRLSKQSPKRYNEQDESGEESNDNESENSHREEEYYSSESGLSDAKLAPIASAENSLASLILTPFSETKKPAKKARTSITLPIIRKFPIVRELVESIVNQKTTYYNLHYNEIDFDWLSVQYKALDKIFPNYNEEIIKSQEQHSKIESIIAKLLNQQQEQQEQQELATTVNNSTNNAIIDENKLLELKDGRNLEQIQHSIRKIALKIQQQHPETFIKSFSGGEDSTGD